MKILFLCVILSTSVWAQKKVEPTPKVEARVQDLRSFIGSTFSPPVSYNGKLYFVATTGVLYEGNSELSSVNKLYMGKKQSLGNLSLDNGILYWGEGLHTDKKSALHAFDIKKGKVKEIEVEGHIQRAPLIKDDMIYVGLGPAGIAAFKTNSLSKVWQTREIDKKKIHVDGNLVFYDGKICTSAIYDFKAVICLEPSTGKSLDVFPLKKNPKGEVVLSKDLLIGFSTEADMTNPNWTVPSDLYVVNLKTKKVQLEKELRGFNFFAPLVQENRAYVNLSTGDFIVVNLEDGKIEYMGEFPEPFINNTFSMNGSICGLGVMGKLMCFSRGKSNWGLAVDKRYMESPVGKIAELEGKIYAPSRVGYFTLEP